MIANLGFLDLSAQPRAPISMGVQVYHILIVSLCLFAFSILRSAIHADNIDSTILALLASGLLGVLFVRVEYPQDSRVLRILVSTLVVLSTLYVWGSSPYFILHGGPDEINRIYSFIVETGSILCLVFGVLALCRPSFSLYVFVFVSVQKTILGDTSGIPISETDYAVIVETGMFAVIAMNIYWLLENHAERRNDSLAILVIKSKSLSSGDIIALMMLAVHFSNYFYAGYAKVALDGPFLAWIFNHTYNIFYASLIYKQNPLMGYSLIEYVGPFLENSYLITNAAVLFFQISCFVALFHRVWAISYIVFFDLMHVVIFLTTGIFFWKWIILNSVLILIISNWSFKYVPTALFAFSVGLLFVAPNIFYIPSLGWWDTRVINHVLISAVLDNGKKVALPSNYFRNYSVTFAQHRVGRQLASHAPTGAYGVSWSFKDYTDSFSCKSPVIPASSVSNAKLSHIKEFIRGYHDFALQNLDKDGRLLFNWFPHHIWASVSEFSDANLMSLQNVSYYELTVRTKCIEDLSNMKTQILHDTLFDIPLDPLIDGS